jgi:integrase
MARTVGRLTAIKVRTAKPRLGGGASLLCDGGGLWLQVTVGKAGQINRSWIFRYATPDVNVSEKGHTYRRERQMGLGPLHTVDLAVAREMAREARLLVKQGKDPLDTKNASRAALRSARASRYTFAAAAEAYLQRFENGWKNPRHRAQWRNTLRDYMLPVLGPLDIEAIDTEAVLRVLEPIWTKLPETASRVRGRIETVLDFAGRNGSNPARWKGHVEHRLAKRNKRRTVKHLAALPYTEVGPFITTLRSVNSTPARALEFTILCATRTNETVGARWDEIDFEERVWVIPAHRTKRDREHRVPLSDAAIAVLRFMVSIRQDDRVFPIGYQAMFVCLKERRSDLTVHGFRATFRSWAGARTDHPRDVCEAALGHSVGNAVEAAYMREDLLIKRRRLMSDWAAFCGSQEVPA